MAVETNSADVTFRRRNVGTTSSSPSGSTEGLNNNLNHNNNDDSSTVDKINDDSFDAEMTTLDETKTVELLTRTQNLSHDEALNKLKEIGSKTPILPSQIGTDFNYKRIVVWPNAIGFVLLHICGLIGILLVMLGQCYFQTALYGKFFIICSCYSTHIIASCIHATFVFFFFLQILYPIWISFRTYVWIWIGCNNGSTQIMVASCIQS